MSTVSRRALAMATSHVESFAVVVFRCRRGVGAGSATRGGAALPAAVAALPAAAPVLPGTAWGFVAAVVDVLVRGAATPEAFWLLFAAAAAMVERVLGQGKSIELKNCLGDGS